MASNTRRRHLAILVDDLRRNRDTAEKLNSPADHRVTRAAALMGEAAALLKDASESSPAVERFGR